jgi:hypothetical protein
LLVTVLGQAQGTTEDGAAEEEFKVSGRNKKKNDPLDGSNDGVRLPGAVRPGSPSGAAHC